MTQKETVSALVLLGNKIKAWLHNENYSLQLSNSAHSAVSENEWFTVDNIRQMLSAITLQMLDEQKITEWLSGYKFCSNQPKRVGIIAAGNIPLVFFHDFICVLVSQNIAVVKFSSKDKVLSQCIVNMLIEIDPRIKNFIEIADEKQFAVDCVIATGSDNTLKFFEEKYGAIPHIFRANRTSVAIIRGDESVEELELLGNDIFSFFGLGCRNVSKIFIPNDYDLTKLIEAAKKFSNIKNHNLYMSAYQYNKAFLTITKKPFIDNDFWLLSENSELFSPVSVVYCEKYSNLELLKRTFSANSEQIQCIMNYNVAFGQSQQPQLTDYADGLDVMQFLLKQNR
jgi:hypothetical protein